MPFGAADAPWLGRLPTLPVFFILRDRRVVLAGGGPPAVWKAEVLCATGAQVDVYAADPCAELVTLAAGASGARLRLHGRPWRPEDLVGAALALGAIDDDVAAAAFRAAAVDAGVPVNIIDKPHLCDFQFGTLIERSPLVLAITTDGAAPVFGQAIRARIEALLPEGLREWAEAAKTWRPAVQARDWSFRKRRRFWEVFAALALENADRPPSVADRQSCFAAAEALPAAAQGRVTLVGCGSGRLEDVTFAAVRALQAAGVVIYDEDVGSELINLARRESRKAAATTVDVTAIGTLVHEGQTVAWLGTGDSATCPRWIARTSSLAALSISPVCLPGIRHCPQCGPSSPAGYHP